MLTIKLSLLLVFLIIRFCYCGSYGVSGQASKPKCECFHRYPGQSNELGGSLREDGLEAKFNRNSDIKSMMVMAQKNPFEPVQFETESDLNFLIIDSLGFETPKRKKSCDPKQAGDCGYLRRRFRRAELKPNVDSFIIESLSSEPAKRDLVVSCPEPTTAGQCSRRMIRQKKTQFNPDPVHVMREVDSSEPEYIDLDNN